MRRLVSSVREMNYGIRRKKFRHGSIPSVFTIRSQDCQTTTYHAANHFSNDLQWDPDPFSLQGMFNITDVDDIMALSHQRPKWSMGERSGDLTGHCNMLTSWMCKMFWVCLTVCGRALLCWKIPTLCCCKYGTTTGSTIPSRQQNAFNRAACGLFLTVLSQTLVPVAFLGKRPYFRPERNLLRDEVVRKRSYRGVVLCGMPDLDRSATFPVC